MPLPAEPHTPGLLQLLTPKGHLFVNTTFANAPRQRRSMERPTLEMAHEDAAMRGLFDGQEVELRNGRGMLRVQLAVSNAMHRGVVALPGKWWDADLGGGVGVNELTAPAWSAAGQPAYNETFVEVLPVL